MRRGEVYRVADPVPERGGKPGFYVVVSRDEVAGNDKIETVIVAPVYSEILGLATEIVLDSAHGIPIAFALRCDFLRLMFKRKLTGLVGRLTPGKVVELDAALMVAVGVGPSA